MAGLIRRKGCQRGHALRAHIQMSDENMHRLARLAARYDTLMYRDAAIKEKRLLNEARLRYDEHVEQCEECS